MKPLVFAFSLLTIVAVSTKAKEAVKLDFDYDSFWKRIQSSKDETKALQLEPILLPRLKEEERDLFKELLHFTEELKDSQSALKLLETSITHESSAVLYYFAANLYTVEDNIPKAVEYYLETLERHPTFAQAIKNVSVILAQSGYHREAIPFLSRAIELGVNDSQTWGLLGFCQVNVNENTAAEKSYRNAIIYDSTVRDWKLGLARSLLASQKYNEAISILQEILIDTPDDDIVLSVQADAYIALDRPNDAAGNYALIHRLGKANAQYLVQLGSIYLFNDLNEMGTQTIMESLAMPDSLAFSEYSDIADNLILRGSFDNATKLISSLRKHKESDSNESLLAKFEVKIALGKGEFENLVPLLTELVKLDPNDGESLLMLAETHSRRTEYDKADIYFKQAKEIEELEVKAALAWAESLVDRKLYERAIEELEFVAINDDREFIQTYLENVRRVYRATPANSL